MHDLPPNPFDPAHGIPGFRRGPVVKLYGIASRQSRGDVDDWSVTRESAEEKLRQVLEDESEWADVLYVAEVEFDAEPN